MKCDMSSIASLFPTLPTPLATSLDKTYNSVKRNFSEGKFEPSELNGGKFSEVVIRILQWYTSPSHTYVPLGKHIPRFSDALQTFQSLSSFPDSIRFHIPRVLEALYGIRNNRGVGHISGDIDSNHMDALFVVSAADWVTAELVRIFHNLSPAAAQKVVESLVTKKIPIVWNIGTVKRVLNPQLTAKDKSLVLLYEASPEAIQLRQSLRLG